MVHLLPQAVGLPQALDGRKFAVQHFVVLGGPVGERHLLLHDPHVREPLLDVFQVDQVSEDALVLQQVTPVEQKPLRILRRLRGYQM